MAKEKVLLVDDERDFLEIMGQVIEYWGYDVLTAPNAKEAMEAFKEKAPDIIILDYVMPDMNGVELLGKIRAIDKDIPVVMFTARPEADAIVEAEKLDIAAFIPKLSPYVDTKKNLKSALEMALKRRKKA